VDPPPLSPRGDTVKDSDKRDDEAPEAVEEAADEQSGEEQDEAASERADEVEAENEVVIEEVGTEGESEVVVEPDIGTGGEGEVLVEEAEEAIAADLERARTEAALYLDDLRRLQADFDNYRKRTLREQTARAAAASQALVTRLLPVLDNFELAVSAAEQSRDFDRMLKGVEMVFGELREVLEGEGLVKIEAEGKPFDPERHEAVVAVEQEDTEPGTVTDIVRTGYELRGKVLRPAMVKVAK
jgi:molecular chaperone GrpE